jgi:hypothetical protein
MSEQTSSRLPDRNPVTHAIHRKQSFWQITFPLILILLVFLAVIGGVIYASLSGSGEVSRWADISLIWLLPLPTLLCFMSLIIFIGLVVGVFKLTEVTPRLTRLLHNYILIGQGYINRFSDKVVEPFYISQSFTARLRALRSQLPLPGQKLPGHKLPGQDK